MMKGQLYCWILGIVGAIVIVLVARYFYVPYPMIVNATLAEPFTLQVGDYAQIKSENLTIELYNISDSRCPLGVQCIWAGQVSAAAGITGPNQTETNLSLVLGSGNDILSVKSFDGYSIKLVKVDPYPQANQTTGISDYSAVFVVFRS
jgi:hypothetical protein